MNQKRRAFLMLCAVSFFVPMGEVLILKHRAEPWSIYSYAYALLSAYAIYWWYVVDKRERAFRAGAIQNIGVAFLSFIALPIYFFRSRGWKWGLVNTVSVFAIVVALGALGYLGETIGEWVIAL
jgi:CDP-diglyceride synthetase